MVAEAQAILAQAGDTTEMRRDPYQLILAGLSATLGILPRAVHRWEAAVDDVIAARDPMTPEERQALVQELIAATMEGAYRGTRKEAARMVRRLDRGLAVRLGLGMGGAFVAGCMLTAGAFGYLAAGPFRPEVQAGEAWRALLQINLDPRPALAAAEIRTDRASGRRYYAGVSLWMDPPAPPPSAAANQPTR